MVWCEHARSRPVSARQSIPPYSFDSFISFLISLHTCICVRRVRDSTYVQQQQQQQQQQQYKQDAPLPQLT